MSRIRKISPFPGMRAPEGFASLILGSILSSSITCPNKRSILEFLGSRMTLNQGQHPIHSKQLKPIIRSYASDIVLSISSGHSINVRQLINVIGRISPLLGNRCISIKGQYNDWASEGDVRMWWSLRVTIPCAYNLSIHQAIWVAYY